MVRVAGGSQQTINYVISNRSYASSEEKARREFESYKISVYVRGDTAWVVGEWQGSRPRRSSSEFVINVPRNTDLVKVETDGGDLAATAIAGRVEGETGGGSIHLDDIGGAVNAETGGGSIDVGTVGGELTLRTGGGSIKVASAKGKINAETGGGSVVVVSGHAGRRAGNRGRQHRSATLLRVVESHDRRRQHRVWARLRARRRLKPEAAASV